MTDEKVKERRHATVELAGREYTIYALPMGASRRWRETFGQPVQTILGVLQNADTINLQNVKDLTALLHEVGDLVLGSTDILVNALFAYSPELQQDREWIEENADDTEAIAALWEVVKLAYPFGALVNMLQRGQAQIGTSSKSAGRNGTSTRKR